MSKFILIAAALLSAPAPVFAQIIFDDGVDVTKFTPTKQDKLKSDWDKVECRNQDVLGSRLERHHVCLTKWQWWTYEQETKQWIQSMERLGEASH